MRGRLVLVGVAPAPAPGAVPELGASTAVRPLPANSLVKVVLQSIDASPVSIGANMTMSCTSELLKTTTVSPQLKPGKSTLCWLKSVYTTRSEASDRFAGHPPGQDAANGLAPVKLLIFHIPVSQTPAGAKYETS